MKNPGPARHRVIRIMLRTPAQTRAPYDYMDMMTDRAWNLRNLGECPEFQVPTCKDALRAAQRLPSPALP